MEPKNKLQITDGIDQLKSNLDFFELEERLEMVQLSAVAADDHRCNGRCDKAPAPSTPTEQQ